MMIYSNRIMSNCDDLEGIRCHHRRRGRRRRTKLSSATRTNSKSNWLRNELEHNCVSRCSPKSSSSSSSKFKPNRPIAHNTANPTKCPSPLMSKYNLSAVNSITSITNYNDYNNPQQSSTNINRHNYNNYNHSLFLNRHLLSTLFLYKSSCSNNNKNRSNNIFYKHFPLICQILVVIVATLVLALPIHQVNADSSVCSIQQFQCGPNFKCIPLSQKCDGFADCIDSSDEIGCPVKKCSPEEFSCSNGKCIDRSWHCDRENDCGDNSDEQDCEMTCQPYQFKCDTSKQCIAKVAVCDGIEDCDDGTDENLPACLFHRPVCDKGQFHCTNGHCVPNQSVCNGVNDCGDNTDETLAKCNNVDRNAMACSDQQFQCHNSSKLLRCVPLESVCDHRNDCEFGEDEATCPELVPLVDDNSNDINGQHKGCNPGQFECHNQLECMDQKLVCDRTVDCSDGSDELNCDYSCSADQFMCSNQQLCIPLTMLCDGIAECSDQSDEFNCTYTTISIPSFESTVLNTTVQSPIDIILNYTKCSNGYRFDPDGQICNDIDECAEDYSLCSGHECSNNDGSFECNCHDGFKLVKGQYCLRNTSNEQPNSMIYSTQNQLQLLKWSTKLDEWTNSTEISFGNLIVQNQSELFNIKYSNQSIIFDYNIHSNYYVASDMAGQFYIDRLDKSREITFDISTPSVFIGKDTTVRSIAIDWINHLLLFVNKRHRRIEALKLSKLSTVYILVPNLDQPQDIEVNPFDSWFVWSDIFHGKARICQFAYNGSFGKILVSTDIFQPTGLAIDHPIKRIFWLDEGTNSISSIDYNGNDRRLILQSKHFVGKPFDIDVLDNNVYWSDLKTNTIYTCNKFGKIVSDNQLEIHPLFSIEQVSTIAIVDRYKQPTMPTQSRCNLDCPFVCSIAYRSSSQTPICQCPDIYKLIGDKCVNSSIENNQTKLIIKSKSFVFVHNFNIFYAIIAAVVLVAFCVPYLFKYITTYLSNEKRNYRWVKLNNLNESLAAKTIRLNSSVSCDNNNIKTNVDRLDDVSSGYSSITEQISEKQDTTDTGNDDDTTEDGQKFII